MRSRRVRFARGLLRLMLVKTLLRLYPRAWRERYGSEFEAFLAQTKLTGSALFDIVRAAAIERGRTGVELLFGRTGSARYVRMVLSRTLLPFLAAWIIAAAGWLLGNAVDGTSVAAALSQHNAWRFFLPVFAIGRHAAYQVLTVGGQRRRLVIGRIEATAWISLALVSSIMLRLDTLKWHHSADYDPTLWALDWNWWLSPMQFLLISLYVLISTPGNRHVTELALRLRKRRQPAVPKRILRIDG